MKLFDEVKVALASLAEMCGNTASRVVAAPIIHEDAISSADYINTRGLDALGRMLQFQGDCAAVVRSKDGENSVFKIAFNGKPNNHSKATMKNFNDYILNSDDSQQDLMLKNIVAYSKSYNLCSPNHSTFKFVWNKIKEFVNSQRLLGIEEEGLQCTYDKYQEPNFTSLCSILEDLKLLQSNEDFVLYIVQGADTKQFITSLYQICRAQIDIDKFIHITLQDVKFDADKTPIIISKNDEGIHCELVFLSEEFDYIGLSKLSCLLCYEIQRIVYKISQNLETPPVLGGHGVNYADKWNMPSLSSLSSKEKTLTQFRDFLYQTATLDVAVDGHFRHERIPSLYHEDFSEDDYDSDDRVDDVKNLCKTFSISQYKCDVLGCHGANEYDTDHETAE